MENTEYYEGLYKFLTKTPSGLKSIYNDTIYLIKENELVISREDNVRYVHKIIGVNFTKDFLKLEIEDDLDSVYYIKKTEDIDELGKPIFEIELFSYSSKFTLFLIKPEEN